MTEYDPTDIRDRLENLGKPDRQAAHSKGVPMPHGWKRILLGSCLGFAIGSIITVTIKNHISIDANLSPEAMEWIVLEIAQSRDITPKTAKKILEQLYTE